MTDNHGVSAAADVRAGNGRPPVPEEIDAAGNPTSYTYDAAGRLLSLTAPREQGSTATMTYAYSAA